MKIKCEYCNNYIDDSEEKCSGCGAPNKNYQRTAIGVPTTIEELQQWYEEHHLPPSEVTRFFIGVDYKNPKAFGIYKDENTGKFIVYKNKDTGERAIRYEGNDEKYAVNELYLKLKEQIGIQKNINAEDIINRINANNAQRKSNDIVGIIMFLAFFAFVGFVMYSSYFAATNRVDKGYYNINDKEYYYGGGNWYIYSNDDWVSTSKPDYSGDLDDYYEGDYYSSSSDYSNIKDSDVYDYDWDRSSSSSSWGSSSSSSSHDDWDWDSDWDSGSSWDSGGSDWGSDW